MLGADNYIRSHSSRAESVRVSGTSTPAAGKDEILARRIAFYGAECNLLPRLPSRRGKQHTSVSLAMATR